MAKFLFTYISSREGVVKEGNPKGGSITQTLVWMKALHALGHEVYQAKYEDDKREYLEEYKWVKPVSFYHSKKFKKFFVWFSYRFPKIFKVLQENKFDFIYMSMPHWTCYFTGLICKLTDTKQIIRIANDKNVDRTLANDNSVIQNFLQDLGLKVSFAVLTQNRFQFEKINSMFSNLNLLNISNPIVIDKNFLKEKSQHSGYLAWLANFRHQKNLQLLYAVAISLPNEQIKIAGQPLNPMDEETELFFNKLQELDNVEFVGVISRKDILEFLDKAKFLLSTSRYEGFSNTFLESMVTGTPIITTTAVNPDGIIDEFGLGYLYKDEIELKNIFDNMSTSDYQLKSKNCIEYVINYHDHLVLGKKMMQFLNKDFQ